MYPNEAKDLADEWEWEDPEKAKTKEKEAGMTLQEIAETRIEAADENYDSILETMNKRTMEEFQGTEEELKQALLTNEMIAREMRNEELKYL